MIIQAVSAFSFLATIGVNTHLSWQDPGSGYAKSPVVQSSVAYLGAKLVRDGVPYEWWTLPTYIAMAKSGVRFTILPSTPIDIAGDLDKISKLAQAAPGSIAAIEGANEYNTNDYTFGGVASRNNAAWAKPYSAGLYSAVKANPLLKDVPVIASSTANANDEMVTAQGDLSSVVDSSNWHVYFGQGGQPAKGMRTAIRMAKASAPLQPVTITETGYYTAVDAMDWGGGGVTPAVQAIGIVNVLLDGFKQGVKATYLYELMDNIANPASTDLENSFGLFLADGTPKLAATAVHNLTTILADGSVKPVLGVFDVSMTGLPPSASWFVLQKSSGSFFVVLWDEPPMWNQPTKSPVVSADVTVILQTNASATLCRYDPFVGTSPLQSTVGTAIKFALGQRAQIVEVVLAK